jgi:hypothetical protein
VIALPPRQRLAARMTRLAQVEEQGGKFVLSLSQCWIIFWISGDAAFRHFASSDVF